MIHRNFFLDFFLARYLFVSIPIVPSESSYDQRPTSRTPGCDGRNCCGNGPCDCGGREFCPTPLEESCLPGGNSSSSSGCGVVGGGSLMREQGERERENGREKKNLNRFIKIKSH